MRALLVTVAVFLFVADDFAWAKDKKKFKRRRSRGPAAVAFAACKEKQHGDACNYTAPNQADIQGKCHKAEGTDTAYCLANGIAPYAPRPAVAPAGN